MICGSAIGSLMPLLIPRSAGLTTTLGVEVDVDPVVADARFVDERGAEDVRLVDRHHLPFAAARIAEAGHRVALRVRFLPVVLLVGVVAVQVVLGAEVVAEVDRVLVDR